MLEARSGIHLSKQTKTWINWVGIGVWITGLGWMAVHYVLEPRDAANFGGNSEPQWLKWHGAFAVLATATAGLLWGVHIVKAWMQGRHRWSGGALAGSLTLLMVSGYLLYYVADERARSVISLLHQLVGLPILLTYLIHRLVK